MLGSYAGFRVAGGSAACARNDGIVCAAKPIRFLVGAAPKVPAQLVTGLNSEINWILQVPETRDALSRQGADPLGSTPEEFAATIVADLAKWAKVVAAAGIKADQ